MTLLEYIEGKLEGELERLANKGVTPSDVLNIADEIIGRELLVDPSDEILTLAGSFNTAYDARVGTIILAAWVLGGYDAR